MNELPNIRRYFTLGMAACLIVSCALKTHAQEQPTSLEEQLSQDLDDDLLSDLAPISDEDKPMSDDDRQLRRDLGGEDLGQHRAANLIGRVANTMKQIRDRLRDRDLAVGTQQMQARIVRDLDDLIDQLKKQQAQQPQGGGRKKSRQQSETQGQQKKKDRTTGNSSGSPANTPAGDSTTRLGSAETAELDAATRDRLMQETWGNLPAAARQQMQSARPERFLPKYSRLIEDYFKRLSEEKEDR
jgi:hypothetical protein